MESCTQYKSFCQAITELASFEEKKGTAQFVKDVIDRGSILRGRLVISHHPVLGGGDPKNKEIEDTEFTSPRLPFFVDIEYVEVGYALQKQGINPALMHLGWVGLVKPLSRWRDGLPQKKEPMSDFLNNTPNLIGIRIGRLIAQEYKNISDFALQLCAAECGAPNATFKLVKRYGEFK